MQIDGVQVALRYRGTRDIPAATVTYLYSRLKQLVRVGTDPFQQSFELQVDDRQVQVRLWVNRTAGHLIDIVDDSCTDLIGFLLWRKTVDGQNKYFASFTDGTFEEIKPLDEQTGQEVLAGYEVPSSITASPTNVPPVSSSLYSGQMREVVQCYYLGSDINPFSYTPQITHGILESPARSVEPEANPTPGNFFIIEISGAGVYAMPVEGGKSCCASWDVDSYLADEDEPAQYRTKLSLSWNALSRDPTRRPLVYTLITAADMSPVYALGNPFSPLAGWAFSRSGHEAQQVLQVENFSGFDVGSTTENYYACSRVKIAFSVTPEGIPSAVKTVVELNKRCTFSRPNNVMWVPQIGTVGIYDGVYIHLNQINGQDAPVYVFYIGDEEAVLRYYKSFASFPSSTVGPPYNASGHVLNFTTSIQNACPADVTVNTCVAGTNIVTNAYTGQTSGFKLTGPNPIVAYGLSESGHDVTTGVTTAAGTFFVDDPPFLNASGSDDPDCGGPGCAGLYTQDNNYDHTEFITRTVRQVGLTRGYSVGAVIPQFEREGVVLVRSPAEAQSAGSFENMGGILMRTRWQHFANLACVPLAGLNPCCPLTDYDVAACSQVGGSSFPPTSYVDPFDRRSGSFDGEATMRGRTYSALFNYIPDTGPDGAYEEALIWIKDEHETISLPTLVIGGGLYYEEEEDVNAVNREVGYVFAPDFSEFVYDGQLLTFVGRI